MTSTVERREKAWDTSAARQVVLDNFWTEMKRRCGRKGRFVSVSFNGFQRLTQSDELPDGTPLNEVRAGFSGDGRVSLVEAYGLYWRAVVGVGIQVTDIAKVGLAWYVTFKYEQSKHGGEIISRLSTASCIGASPKDREAFGKIAAMGEELTSQAKQFLARTQKLLPPVEPPDPAEMDDEE